jgi:hypothetical protein
MRRVKIVFRLKRKREERERKERGKSDGNV